jgi:hypothetical protein
MVRARFHVMATCACLMSLTIPLPGQTKASAQERTTTKLAAGQANFERQNRFVLSPNGEEYDLAEPITLGTSDTTTQKVRVQSQVGMIEGKPAFATLLVELEKAPKTTTDADSVVNEFRSSGLLMHVQRCVGTLVCTDTKLIQGKWVCVRWTCVRR